jgi:streptomycin 6-kinase
MTESAVRRDLIVTQWRVGIETWHETPSSLIGFGRRDDEPVVLKIVKQHGDEWRSGDVLRAFGGHGVVRVLEHEDGAMLLERLEPGEPLVDLVRVERDEEATEIIASVIASMPRVRSVPGAPTVGDWMRGFSRYVESDDAQVPRDLVERADELYAQLCTSQRATRLLHGDLQHSNILRDANRGWLAIDPKGVIGEIEYEVGAMMRNPREMPELLANPKVIQRRIDQLTSILSLDASRVLAWTFAQAVLSAIWSVEDDGVVDARDPSLLLAHAVRPLLP